MSIEYTHRTITGLRARILCRNRKSRTHPVAALVESANGQEETLLSLTESLHRSNPVPGDLSEPYLQEVSEWEDVPIDTLIWAYDSWGKCNPAYFAGYKNGFVYVWSGGRTSITALRGDGGMLGCRPEHVFLQKPE